MLVLQLEFRGNNTWEITVDGRPVARYDGTNLRFSFVWRALCFESTEDREQYVKRTHATQRVAVDLLVHLQPPGTWRHRVS